MDIKDMSKAAELWAQHAAAIQYLESLKGREGDIQVSPGTYVSADRLRKATEHHLERVTFKLRQLGAITTPAP